ncbi:MAG: tetratricopeptide repeat-containing protein kinase family protein, partial [Myxococcota bacterium]
ARGLHAAHQAGLVHRDFKPGNAMVSTRDGRDHAHVLDFGLTITAGDDSAKVAGTPAYMPPEQRIGDPATPAGDQYSFFVTLYEALTGKRPRARPAPLDDIPRSLRSLVRTGLHEDPEQRHASMAVVAEALAPAQRSSRVAGIAALGLLGVGLAANALNTDDPQASCRDAAQIRWSGLWNPETSAALDERFETSASWPKLSAGLDAYGKGWAAAWDDACRATHVEKTQSLDTLALRTACLDADLTRAAAAIDSLERGSERTVQSVLTSASLTAPDCTTVRLQDREPPPTEPEALATYDATLLAATKALARAKFDGQPESALEDLATLAVDETSHPVALAAVEAARGECHFLLGAAEESAKAYRAAIAAAERARDDHTFVDLTTNLAFVEGVERSRYDVARTWLAQAMNRGQRIQLMPVAKTGLALARASVERTAGESGRAIQMLEEALAGPLDGLLPHVVGSLHNNLANAYVDQHAILSALEHLREGLRLRLEGLGERHRAVGQSRLMLGRMLTEANEFDEASEELNAAAELFAELEGAHAEQINALEGAAILEAMRGNLEAATTRMGTALDVAQAHLGADNRLRAQLGVNYGRMLMMQGKLKEARARVATALAFEERVLGPTHAALADTLTVIAEIELAAEDGAAAKAATDRARTLTDAPGHILQLRVMGMQADALQSCDVASAQAAARTLLDDTDLEALGLAAPEQAGIRASIETWSGGPGCRSAGP